jgi:site-specific recombinase XerD
MIASGVLQNINFHSARHTFAMTARERGLDPYLIAKLMGYKTLAMTSVYSKIHETEKIEALLSLQEKRK